MDGYVYLWIAVYSYGCLCIYICSRIFVASCSLNVLILEEATM